MSDDWHDASNLWPAAPPCSLRQACAKKGLDRGGERCPSCPLQSLCQSELRWLIQSEHMPRYRC